MNARIQALQDRLLHVTARNRSILLGTLSSTLDVAALGPKKTDEALRRLLRGTSSVMLVPDSAHDASAEARRRQASALARRLRHQYDETGLRNGHVGFPFLTGALDADTWVRAPLILIPARLWRSQGRHPGWRVELREGTRPTANRALLAAIAKVRGVRLDDTFVEALETLLEQHAEAPAQAWDLPAMLADVQDLLAQHGIDVPMEDTSPSPVEPLGREAREACRAERLHLSCHVVMSDFPQTNEAIHEDYEALRAAVAETGPDVALIARLLDEPIMPLPSTEPPMLDDVADHDIGTVLPSNGRQDEILVQARERPCTVIRGPPGTGKSQIITNLVADSLHHGRRVLVVCQKRAALDIVQQRLDQAGLGDLSLLVHDAVADRKAAFERLQYLIEGDVPERRDVQALCAEIDGLVDGLDHLAGLTGRMHRGLPVHTIYGEADPEFRPTLGKHGIIHDTDWPQVQQALEAIDAMGTDVMQYRIEHAWRDRPDLSRDPPRREEVAEGLHRILEALDRPRLRAEPQELQELEQACQIWSRHHGDWLRLFRPSFMAARRRIETTLQQQGRGIDAAGHLAAEVRNARALHAAVDDAPGLSAAMRQRILGQPAEAARDAIALWNEGLEDWDRMVQIDQDLAALPARVRRLVLLALRRFDHPKDTLRQEVLHAWIDDLEEQGEVRGDPFHAYEQRRGRLERRLAQRRTEVAAAIHDQQLAAARTPLTVGARDLDHAISERQQALAVLRRKRNVPTLRQLLHDERFGIIWQQAARCWLMSPEAVSAVHPLRAGDFDLVIFDEASQLAAERALPAIYRGKHVVVAGDEQQLPPFDLFQGDQDDDIEADSLLSLARAAFGCSTLEWHYRSEHQELVEFSNHAYYDGALKVVPSPASDVRPIRYHRIAGRFIDRRNPIEAQAVVALVDDLLLQGRTSIGVVTFNQAQRDLIEEQIEARQAEDAGFDERWSAALDHAEAPFVKNIENVQGDERDVIAFSTTYGPGADGRVRGRFGVFNVQGGEHRLNVAITRARRQVHVVTSLDPEQLDVSGSKHLGPIHLKAYLTYARAVDAGDRVKAQRVLQGLRDVPDRVMQQTPSEMHMRMVRALEAEGLVATPLMGFSGYRVDVAVAHPDDPDRFLVAVEMDGPHFRDARGARERDVARQAFLEMRGWRLERVWSRNWFRHPHTETARIVSAVERAH